MSLNGADVLILVNTGTPTLPVYEAVGSQRDATITENTANRDSSSKDSRAQRVDPGRYSSTFTLDALYIYDDNGYIALESAMRDGEKILVRIEREGAEVEEAECVINTLTKNFPDQETSTFTADFTVDGFWSPVGS